MMTNIEIVELLKVEYVKSYNLYKKIDDAFYKRERKTHPSERGWVVY